MNKLILLCVFLFANASAFSQTVLRAIRPSDTNPLITTFNTDSHYVYINPTSPPKNVLLVHLPGSFGEPKRATLFGTLAADLGFHSIGLMYPNVPTVGSFCTNSSDITCFEDVRREIVDGIDHSNDIAIASNESILSRTQKLLTYLNTTYPTENWGQYLDANGNLNFNKIIFSGHSQGGGHAAIIAKFYPINRALCFSSPKDWRNIPDAPPLWLSSGTWATPKSAIYCFNHVLDEHTNHQLEIWDSLGLNNYGPPVNVDSFSSPYNHTRQLTTSYNVPTGDDHACTIQDNKTPKISGIPAFLPVWTHMLTHNLTTGLSAQPALHRLNFQLNPNPTSDFVNLDLKEHLYKIALFDQTGKLIFEQHALSGNIHLNLTTLSAGIYFIQIIGDEGVFTGKIIKQ